MRTTTIKTESGAQLVVECDWDDEHTTNLWVASAGESDGPGVLLDPETVQQLMEFLRPSGARALRDQAVRDIVNERRASYRKAARNTNAPTPVERLAIQRDNGCCVRCGRHVEHLERGTEWSLQHRSNRGMGGSQRVGVNTVPNLVVLCGSAVDGCHGHVEAHNDEALGQGWSISKFANPLTEPVFVFALGRKVWLTANGRYSDEPPSEVA